MRGRRGGRRQRHPRPSAALQQRHRLEQQPLVVERAPGPGQEEPPRALPAGQRPLVELGLAEPAPAAGAAVAERERVALHAGDDQLDPGDARRPQLALGEPVGGVEVEPARRLRARAGGDLDYGELERPGPGSGRLRGGHRSLDHQALEIGRRLLERRLDRQLERRGGGRAPVAAALEADPGDPVLDPEQLDVPAVRLHVRAHAVESLDDPLVERDRVEAVDQHQARDDAVGRQALAQHARRLVLGHQRQDPLQPDAVDLDHRADELLGARSRDRVGDLLERRRQGLDALDQLLGGGGAGPRGGRGAPVVERLAQHIPVGVCITLRTLPPPVYMCTPHGRHGSKLRTARMMSTPLKFSGPFSSKIGVFCTASS